MFFKFGLAAETYFKNLKKSNQPAIIAKDTRLSGYTLEPALVSGLASAGNACVYFGPIANQWSCNVNKRNEGKYGNNDYSVSQSLF
jgi:Phosphomannomutase